jgi:hypothetical protein
MNLEKQPHHWLKSVRVSFRPGALPQHFSPYILDALKRAFSRNGHQLSQTPSAETDIVVATGEFERPLSIQDSATFWLWRNYKLNQPTVFSLAYMRTDDFAKAVERLANALKKASVAGSDYSYAGLSPGAHRVLSEQGGRGGPILALARILQAQLKCIRVILFVGDELPSRAYHFDLVGSTAHTRLRDDEDEFYDDIVHRVATTVSTHQVTQHQRSGTVLAQSTWNTLGSVRAMCRAATEFNRRRFFTNAVSVSDIIDVPSVSENIAKQYSEGCYGTWDPSIQSLVATITGAAKVLNKGDITQQDLVAIERINGSGNGVTYHRVEGTDGYAPSSEAYEMLLIDKCLPQVPCPLVQQRDVAVPIVRSKLHGHRGIRCYAPRFVEYAPVAEAYFRYPVTCGSEAQALALGDALSRAETLNDPADPRLLAFTILPSHGIFIVEKWREDKEPFQLIWEHMDQGALQVEDSVPQELLHYDAGPDGYLTLRGT